MPAKSIFFFSGGLNDNDDPDACEGDDEEEDLELEEPMCFKA